MCYDNSGQYMERVMSAGNIRVEYIQDNTLTIVLTVFRLFSSWHDYLNNNTRSQETVHVSIKQDG